VQCTITNDDKPIDLQLTKSDGDAQPLAGEAFDYTLTITNLGSRDADLGEPVVVTDVLPAGIAWVAPLPANCSAAGQILTCAIDPADLQVGESVLIVLQARIGDIAAPTTFTNKAFVTTADDPACTGDGCVPPCPVAGGEVNGNAANNVDCEDTPASVLTDVQIVKTTPTATVILGSTVSYTLTVSNNGPNTARDVLVVDLMPAPLVLQSVTSTAFTCSSANNAISCTRPSLQIGEVGTITVTALLPETAVPGVNIENMGSVSTSTPESNLANNHDEAAITTVAVAALPPAPPVELPRTGSDVNDLLRLAALLASAGVLALVAGRRRRRGDQGVA